MKILGVGGTVALLALVLAACSSASETSEGTYTVKFPSTAAAVATDFVQILVFDVKSPDLRAGLCQDLITARLTEPGSLAPSVPPAPAVNICAMLAGQKPITIPYGEHALLAIAQRKNGERIDDFMIGCALMTIGDGDAPLAIPLRLVSVNAPIPPSTCASVGDFCEQRCQ